MDIGLCGDRCRGVVEAQTFEPICRGSRQCTSASDSQATEQEWHEPDRQSARWCRHDVILARFAVPFLMFFVARFWGRNSACLLYLYWERILRAQKRVNFWGPKLGHFLHKKLAYFAQEVGLFLSKFGLSGQLALAKLAVRPAVQGTAFAAEFPCHGEAGA